MHAELRACSPRSSAWDGVRPANTPTPPCFRRRAELEERCKYLLASDEIAEAEGLELEVTGVDQEVAKAKADYASQGLEEFNEEAYRWGRLHHSMVGGRARCGAAPGAGTGVGIVAETEVVG